MLTNADITIYNRKFDKKTGFDLWNRTCLLYTSLDAMFCEFVQEVIDKYAVVVKRGEYVEYCNVETVYYDNAETVLGNSIRNAVEKQFPWISVRKAKKEIINDRIRCTVKLMGAGRFFITDDCGSLKTALSDAVWNKEIIGKDERLDDGLSLIHI